MKTQLLSLRKIVSYLNNPDEGGGFWLPNIQRPFVWSEDQICRLFDSLLRQYPISTLLIWKTNMGVRRRKFIDNFKEEYRHRLSNFKVLDDDKKKCLVLDATRRPAMPTRANATAAWSVALTGDVDAAAPALAMLAQEPRKPMTQANSAARLPDVA
jgi:hypothetical protein